MLKVVCDVDHAILSGFVNVVADIYFTTVKQLIPLRLPVTCATGGCDGIEPQLVHENAVHLTFAQEDRVIRPKMGVREQRYSAATALPADDLRRIALSPVVLTDVVATSLIIQRNRDTTIMVSKLEFTNSLICETTFLVQKI